MKNPRRCHRLAAAAPLLALLGCNSPNPNSIKIPVLDLGGPPARSDGGVVIIPPRDVLPPPDDAGVVGAPVDLAGIDGGPDLPPAADCQKNANAPLSWYLRQNVSLTASGPLPLV